MAKWTIDSSHSVAAFSIRHMMIANVAGLFGKMGGTIQFDPPDIAHLSVEAEIDVSSISTGHERRDEHLLTSDFFDVTKYPKIIFKSTKVESIGGNRGKLTGNMTLRGVTQPVTLDFEFSGPVRSPFGGEISIGFSATVKINREDFGIAWNEAMPEGGLVVGQEVKINLDVEADLTPD
jgi:polyisoprenoid-binding protein YceI